ncbi:MAG TPA: hypothetical protein VKP67_04960 [Xanthobacteraceae bacterium]|nr:hypothetical protein [Xanthobacteraceae bacterium]
MPTMQPAYLELILDMQEFREETEVISEIGATADYSIGRPHLDPRRFCIMGRCMGGWRA